VSPSVSLQAFRGRRFPYVAKRAISLARRYGIRDHKAMARVRRCVETLARYDLAPTFATPGSVIEREPAFFRGLEAMGVEFAIHGYDHVDFRLLDDEAAHRQFARAADAYDRNGLSFEGFRCPYLSYTDSLARILPSEMFRYSSNEAISWDVVPTAKHGGNTTAQLEEFYAAGLAAETVSTPRLGEPFVEIPVSLPDDLQLLDGFRVGREEIATAWVTALAEAHRRGELFAPLFHPESFDSVRGAFEAVLDEASRFEPHVWMTQLRDIARWWTERSAFEATTSAAAGCVRVDLDCSERATVLVRDWVHGGSTKPWDGRYGVLSDRTLHVDPERRPFIGIRGASEATVAFLREQGYVLDFGGPASSCTICINAALDSTFGNDVERLDYVESTSGPLVRFSRWPNEAKSALCFAGDLDALSLREYAARVLSR
jgi:peptidoglycan/xylan/chitin deacetylase (PgdA/CDA1 family)